MEYNSTEKNWIAQLNLVEHDLESIRTALPHPKYADFTLSFDPDSETHGEQHQIDSYNRIKDPSWPDCVNYQDLCNLPQHISEECRQQHGFDFSIFNVDNIDRERWENYQSGKWPVWELVRYKHVILDIKSYFKDKTVLDFAGHAGIISLMALHVGAKFVTATNVRPKYVNLANRMLQLSDFKNKFSTAVADIHDYENNTRICQNVDTVLLYGIMYHVHDHCQILDSIAEAKPKNIIIDTLVPNTIIDNPTPSAEWSIENTDRSWNGWMENVSHVAIGKPNAAWFEMYMKLKNYKKVYENKYYANHVAELEFPDPRRSIMVFESLN